MPEINFNKNSQSEEKAIYKFTDLITSKCFQGIDVGCLWSIWEGLLTNRSILIISDDPFICSFCYLVILLQPLFP